MAKRKKKKSGGKRAKARKARKSSKRSRAAKKAARTRRANKEARRLAAKKGARRRKARKGGKRKSARRRRKKNPLSKRQRAARKGARTRKANKDHKKKGRRRSKKRSGGKRRKGKRRSYRSPEKLYEETLRTQQRCEAKIARLKAEGSHAVGLEKERKAKAVEKLKAQQARLQTRLRNAESGASARRRRGKGRRRSGRRRNPLNPLAGWGEAFAGGSGVVVGALFTIGGDRFAATRPLTANATSSGANTFTDTPANTGDVLNLTAPSLPLWSNIKTSGWKRILSAVVNIGAPLFIAGKVTNANGKTFFQLWGYTAIGLTGSKVVIDLATKMLAKTGVGMRLFSPESTAQSVQTASLSTVPSPATVYQGQGYTPTPTGYGRAQVGAASCGSCGGGSDCGCQSCQTKANTLGQYPPATTGGTTAKQNPPPPPAPPTQAGPSRPFTPQGPRPLTPLQPSQPGGLHGPGFGPPSQPGGMTSPTLPHLTKATPGPQQTGGNIAYRGAAGAAGNQDPGVVIADGSAGAGKNNVTSPSNVRQIRRRWG